MQLTDDVDKDLAEHEVSLVEGIANRVRAVSKIGIDPLDLCKNREEMLDYHKGIDVKTWYGMNRWQRKTIETVVCGKVQPVASDSAIPSEAREEAQQLDTLRQERGLEVDPQIATDPTAAVDIQEALSYDRSTGPDLDTCVAALGATPEEEKVPGIWFYNVSKVVPTAGFRALPSQINGMVWLVLSTWSMWKG